MITVTKRAAERIVESINQADATDMVLRLAARVTDDGSYHYGMGFDEIRDGDTRGESEGITIVVAKESRGLLDGCVLDFVEITEGDLQFIFLNPNDPNYVPPVGADITHVPPKHGNN